MVDSFVYADRDITSFGAIVSGSGTYSAPQREYEELSIPGRNGSLLIDKKRYSNVMVTYPCLIFENFATNVENIREWLLSQKGYAKLTDSRHPDEFRIAKNVGGVTVATKGRDDIGSCNITFSCKPQRFLVSGDSFVEKGQTSYLTNPTEFEALPIIRCYGAGTITIGGHTIVIKSFPGEYIDIDCDIMDAYRGATNLNKYITLNDFPILKSGRNGITHNIRKVEIKPRWWRL